MNRLRIVIGVGLALFTAGVGLGKFATSDATTPAVNVPEIARARDGRGRFPRGGNVSSACVVTIQGGAFATDWTETHGGGVVASTLTFNAGSGPPGSCSSNGSLRVQFAATTAASFAGIQMLSPPSFSGSQMCSGGTSNISWGFWAKATTTQSADICQNDNANGTVCFSCSLVANTWVFCSAQNKAWWSASNAFYIGNLTNFVGSGTRSALDVQLYAPRCVVGTSISQ